MNFYYTFAMHCLMEVPEQYNIIKDRALLTKVKRTRGAVPVVAPHCGPM